MPVRAVRSGHEEETRVRRLIPGRILIAVLLLLLMAPEPSVSTGVAAPAAQATPFEPALYEVTNNLSQPVYVTHAGDGSGRVFIVEKGGQIKILVGGRVLPAPFLDVGALISFGYEEGLISMVFHPGYATPGGPGAGTFFVYYTAPALSLIHI